MTKMRFKVYAKTQYKDHVDILLHPVSGEVLYIRSTGPKLPQARFELSIKPEHESLFPIGEVLELEFGEVLNE